ncbi:uncharacterized protein LOC129726209 [Wyeomyia smithii]|uniref:uncharacterized protein LOC129726209 n=1 Tax=Wyeomyia smithii TaxID=174621 RepID=UPI0024680579|nr:uncharacterized protein LOC129726209 [Wyeomyia smithii]
MPLKSINELLEFEELLGNKNNEKKFEKFLASFVLFKKPLEEMTMTFIERVYHLELQTQVNCSGAGAKQVLKSLCSTQVLIKSPSIIHYMTARMIHQPWRAPKFGIKCSTHVIGSGVVSASSVQQTESEQLEKRSRL